MNNVIHLHNSDHNSLDEALRQPRWETGSSDGDPAYDGEVHRETRRATRSLLRCWSDAIQPLEEPVTCRGDRRIRELTEHRVLFPLICRTAWRWRNRFAADFETYRRLYPSDRDLKQTAKPLPMTSDDLYAQFDEDFRKLKTRNRALASYLDACQTVRYIFDYVALRLATEDLQRSPHYKVNSVRADLAATWALQFIMRLPRGSFAAGRFANTNLFANQRIGRIRLRDHNDRPVRRFLSRNQLLRQEILASKYLLQSDERPFEIAYSSFDHRMMRLRGHNGAGQNLSGALFRRLREGFLRIRDRGDYIGDYSTSKAAEWPRVVVARTLTHVILFAASSVDQEFVNVLMDDLIQLGQLRKKSELVAETGDTAADQPAQTDLQASVPDEFDYELDFGT